MSITIQDLIADCDWTIGKLTAIEPPAVLDIAAFTDLLRTINRWLDTLDRSRFDAVRLEDTPNQPPQRPQYMGGWDGRGEVERAVYYVRQLRAWAVSLDTPTPPEAATTAKLKRKGGKPPKGETPSRTKIIGALSALLQKRGQDDPPTGRDVVEASGVRNVSRFIREVFGSHRKFEAAWRRGDVAVKLAKLQYAPEGHAEYRGDLTGDEDD